MEYLPITVRLEKKYCVLVGAGEVAFRKLKHLIKAGAQVTIISPEFSLEVEQLANIHNFQMIKQKADSSHFINTDLVICATNNKTVNQHISELCQARNIWVNVVDDIELSSFIMPAVVDRSPLLIAISTGGVSPVLARKIREKIEYLLPRNLNTLLDKLKILRPKLKSTFSNLKQRRNFSEWYLERAFDGSIATTEPLEHSLNQYINAVPTQGKVYLVGAGPGDSDLLTVKALKLIQKADVVLHDSLISNDIMLSIRKDAKLIDVGKRALSKSAKQQDINNKLVFYARQGLSVVRLKGGDSFIFGRGGEELEYLAEQNIAFEVVPGITAVGCAKNQRIAWIGKVWPVTIRHWLSIWAYFVISS